MRAAQNILYLEVLDVVGLLVTVSDTLGSHGRGGVPVAIFD